MGLLVKVMTMLWNHFPDIGNMVSSRFGLAFRLRFSMVCALPVTGNGRFYPLEPFILPPLCRWKYLAG